MTKKCSPGRDTAPPSTKFGIAIEIEEFKNPILIQCVKTPQKTSLPMISIDIFLQPFYNLLFDFTVTQHVQCSYPALLYSVR